MKLRYDTMEGADMCDNLEHLKEAKAPMSGAARTSWKPDMMIICDE